MAESKFLKYQDPSGDGLIDVCDEFVEIEEAPCDDVCKCIENGAALTPNWLNLSNEETFLNEKKCLYQVVVETPYTTTLDDAGADALSERYEEYADTAVEILIDANDKDDSTATQMALKDLLEYTDYYLESRPNSRLRLLYSVPYYEMCGLEASEEEEETDEDDESDDTEVTYEIQDLKKKLIRVRKGLHLYGMYLKVYRALEGGGLFFLEGDAAGKIFNLKDYGDVGILGGSTMAKILPQLDDFLNRKGLNIRGVGGFTGMFGDTVVKVTIKFNGDYEVKRLLVYTEGCGEKPIIFMKKLRFLKTKSAWKDSTAMAYLAQLTEMEAGLTAREPLPWLEFVEKYTYPQIYSSINQGYANTDPENSAASCIAEALQDEAKQFGQDILDEAFSIGDAIAYQFHKNLCRAEIGEVVKDDIEIGAVWDPNADAFKNIQTMALEQAFQSVEMEDAVFEEFCAKITSDSFGGVDALEKLWTEGFNKIKLCGLYSLLIDSIQCLFGGLSLEETLSTITESALRAMSLENFGDLFIGLPADKQAELDALVKKKFENGEFFEEGGINQQTSDVLAGKLDYTKPWEDEEVVEAQNESEKQPSSTGETMTAGEIQDTSENSRRTLVQQLDAGSAAKKQLSPNVVFEAYVLALIEVYSDNYFELLEELNKFPGAQLIAATITNLDCPLPPAFNPSFLDFVKDADLPFCGNTFDLTMPALQNPFGFIPKIKDLTGFLFEAAKLAIQQAVVKLLMKLMIKVCDSFGSALCDAIGTTAALTAALPDLATGRDNLGNVIRESICGEDTDQEQIDNTIVDMFATLGVGGAALADTEQVMSFAGDISASVTMEELSNAFLGEPSSEFLTIVDSLVEYEYPDFRAGLQNPEDIGSFFGNMGNLMPADFKDQLKNIADGAVGDNLPANPSLCATPEQLEDFCALRAEILDGRATPEQIQKLCDSSTDQALDDLKDLSDILQSGVSSYLADNLPPLFSEPGCDDGILPYESDEGAAVATAALGGMLEQLKVDYAYDMLGNGPGEGRWGFINMILSDTMGNPLTAHMRKVDNRRAWVDFLTDTSVSADGGSWFGDGDAANGILVPRVARTQRQKGAFPYKVADWLEDYMQTKLSPTFTSNNELQEATKSAPESFKDAGVTTFGGDINLLKLPDLGYNVEVSASFENEELTYTAAARKANPDMTLSFQDNCKGLWDATSVSEMYSYGFDLQFYLSDLTEDSAGSAYNLPTDNVRIKIMDRYNVSAQTYTALAATVPDILKFFKPLLYKVLMKKLTPDNTEIQELSDRKFEFASSDATLDDIDLTDYPYFLATFETKQEYLPQIVLLEEMATDDGQTISKTNIKTSYDEIMSTITQNFVDLISSNSASFLYGATYDDLSYDDIEYVIEDDIGSFPAGSPYYEVEILDDDGSLRRIKNNDHIMGISKMQFMSGSDENRVYYLDPGTFGGSYMNPPLYVKPLQNKGWLGLVDVMFPDLSPCKPYRTDLIDFEDIDQKIENSYPTIPEDERLKSDPDCIVEVPYARILERAGSAGLESIITAAIRIYASVYFIKSLATFSKFSPKFPEVFSSIYAAYIVEEMEASYKDAQKAFWEFFNPFKDTEFWYAFLEQSVQLYSRRVDNGEITDPPSAVIDALVRLNNMQEKYQYPYRPELKVAKKVGDAGLFETLKNYRESKNLEAIQATEDDAKLVLKELVIEELNKMGEKFVENLKIIGMAPTIYDLNYYLLQYLAQGGEDLTLDQEIKEEYVDLPTEGEELFTSGNEFALPEGGEYVGYYHVDTDDDGNIIYVTGEFSGDDVEGGELLTPMANKITVTIGDIAPLGSAVDLSDITKPFVIEKYISINGSPHAPSDAVDIIKANDNELNISDVYPGTLELVSDANGQIVGLSGELGVRYGLKFSAIINNTLVGMTTVEVDSLDVGIGVVDPFEGSSKLLLCLLNMLKEDDKFKLVAQYIFPLKKVAATIAIYNGLAFMPAIGEKMVKNNQTVGKFYVDPEEATGWDTGLTKNTIYTKPGVALTFDGEGRAGIYPPNVVGPDTNVEDVTSGTSYDEEGTETQSWDYTPDSADVLTITDPEDGAVTYDTLDPTGGGWTSKLDRDPGLFGGLFVKEWDNWDQTLLRNSKSRIKKIFKSYYNAREFEPGKADDSDSPGTIITSEFKERLKSRPGQDLLPWWRKRMLRTNPFNESGELCEKKD